MTNDVINDSKFKILKTEADLPIYDIYIIYSKHTSEITQGFIELLKQH